MRLLRNPTHKLIYCVISGILLQTFVFGHSIFIQNEFLIVAVILSIANLLCAYALFRYLNRETLGWRIIIYCLAVTGGTHLRAIIVNYGGWDMSVAELFMVQTVHLSYLAWDYADGVKKETKNPKILLTFPTFLEYMAAALCPTCSLGGPEFHVVDFLDYVYSRHDFAVHENPGWPSFYKMFTGFCWLAIYGAVVNKYPISLLYDNYSSQPFYTRVYFLAYYNRCSI